MSEPIFHWIITYRPKGELVTIEYDAPANEGDKIADAECPEGYTLHASYNFHDGLDMKGCVKECVPGEAEFNGDEDTEDA